MSKQSVTVPGDYAKFLELMLKFLEVIQHTTTSSYRAALAAKNTNTEYKNTKPNTRSWTSTRRVARDT